VEGGQEMPVVIVDEVTRELAALVAVVSLAMIGIIFGIFPHCWNRFKHYRLTLSPSVWKATWWLVQLLYVPILVILAYAFFNIETLNRMPSIFIIFLCGIFLLLALIYIGVTVKRKIKRQIVSEAEPHTLFYFTALSYMAVSVFSNIIALIGVSPKMLLISLGSLSPEDFEWAKWILVIGIFAFTMGITFFGITLAVDKARQLNNKVPKENQN
jgi:hypothetical protein